MVTDLGNGYPLATQSLRRVGGRSPLVAGLLELLIGVFLQVWGIGHIYAGRVGAGVAIMLSYWILQAINAVLMTVLIGFVTMPLTWLAYAVISTLAAARAAEEESRWAY